MDLFLAALEKTGPWAMVVLLLYLLWDKDRRDEKGIRETLRDQVAALQLVAKTLDTALACLQAHDKRGENIEHIVETNARSIESVSDALARCEGKLDVRREQR